MKRWAIVPNSGGKYMISSNGKIRNMTTNKILKPGNNAGYSQVGLMINGVRKKYSVHRLVYSAFVGKIPVTHNINHINMKRDDNRVSNLEAVPPSQNIHHGILMRYRKIFGRKIKNWNFVFGGKRAVLKGNKIFYLQEDVEKIAKSIKNKKKGAL